MKKIFVILLFIFCFSIQGNTQNSIPNIVFGDCTLMNTLEINAIVKRRIRPYEIVINISTNVFKDIHLKEIWIKDKRYIIDVKLLSSDNTVKHYKFTLPGTNYKKALPISKMLEDEYKYNGVALVLYEIEGKTKYRILDSFRKLQDFLSIHPGPPR